jgi:hypothetical protein
MLGVSEDPDEIPEHKRRVCANVQVSESQMTQEKTKNLLKTAHAAKVVNPLTCALATPFIGRRSDFYISKVPSNLSNIPNVNTYINAFYIS